MKFWVLTVFTCLVTIPAFSAENLINVTWGDNIMVGSGISKLDTPEKIIISMRNWNDNYDGKIILWRISSEYIRRFYDRYPTPFQQEYDAKVESIAKVFDPAHLLREECNKTGQTYLIYATFLDHGCPTSLKYADGGTFPWQDRVTKAHPEYQERDLEGNFHYGVLDLANPDARKFMIERLVNFVNEYQADGLYLCSRTHSNQALHGDQYGFSPIIVKEYQKLYGIDITKDPRFNYKAPEYAPQSKELDNWRKLRGKYLTQFVRELRKALGNKIFYIGLPRGKTIQAPYGNMFVDKETMVRQNLIDGMVIGVSSGRHTKNMTKHKDMGFFESEADKYNLPSFKEEIQSLQKLSNKVRFYYGAGFQRNPPDAGRGVMMGSPNSRPTPYLLDAPVLNGKSMTLEAFVKISAKHSHFSQAPRIFSKHSTNGPATRGWELMLNEKYQLVYRTQLVDGKGGVRDTHLASTKSVTPDVWQHVAAVFDGVKREKRLYINGEEVAKETVPPGYFLNHTPYTDVIIGCYNYGTQELRAVIDEARITSNSKFAGVPKAPYTGKEPGTVALWHFDGGSGKADVVGKGIDSRFILVPEFSQGKFGQALDITRVD